MKTMRFFKLYFLSILLISFFSCKKDADPIDTTPSFYILNSGTANFDKNLLLFSSSDTIQLNVVVSSVFLLPQATTITVGVSDSYRDAYNIANQTSYKAMPSNAYSFTPQVTAGANSVYDTVVVSIYKQYLLNDDYMLPLAIQSVSNYKIDTANSVLYLHTKSSELSGIYNSSIVKFSYNGNAGDSNLSAVDSFSIPKTLIPVTGDLSQLDYADLGSNGWKYLLSFGDNNTFSVEPNLVIQQSVEEGSFTILSSSFDAETKDIYIKSSYKNTTGNERIVEESLKLQ